jgi:uncharacterized SAM-binding protein YcdF (DUF218 family)
MLLLYLKTVLRQLFLPPAGLLLLGAAGLMLLRRHPRFARALIALTLVTLWLMSTPLVADAIVRLVERYPALDLNLARGAQAIAILGGGGQRSVAPEYGGAPAAGPELLEKLAYGAWVARRTGLPILVTGYGPEAGAMRATLQQNFGLDPRWVDAAAFDTFQNARNAAALFAQDGIHRIILVTRSTHMLRSTDEFRAAGLEVLPAPVGLRPQRPSRLWDYLPEADALVSSYQACYELLGEPVRAFLAATHLRRQH